MLCSPAGRRELSLAPRSASLGFSTSVFPLRVGELPVPCYAALASLVVNSAVTVAMTMLLNIVHAARGGDDTIEADYEEAAHER